MRTGLSVAAQGDAMLVKSVRFGSEPAKYGLSSGDQVLSVLVPADRPSRYWFVIPALLLLAGIALLQHRRRPALPASAAPPG